MSDEIVAVDIVIELFGGAPYDRPQNQVAEEGRFLGLDLKRQDLSGYWDPQQANKRGKRRLDHHLQGVQWDKAKTGPDPFVINRTFGKVMEVKVGKIKIGGVFIVGFSEGAHYAILMAKDLVRFGVNVTLVGVVDFPLSPYGNGDWKIPGCTDMFPKNKPVFDPSSTAKLRRALDPPLVDGPVTDAKVLLNYYQRIGNHMSVQNHLIPGYGALPLFTPYALKQAEWWDSDLPHSEIHGQFVGNRWGNIEVRIPNDLDDYKAHDEGDKKGMFELGRVVATSLCNIWDITG